MARSTRQTRADGNIQLALAMASEESIVQAHVKMVSRLHGGGVDIAAGTDERPFISVAMDRTGVTQEEATRVYWMQHAWWAGRANMIPYLDQLSPGERAEFDSNTRLALGTSAVGRLWYESMKSGLNPDAVRYVDALLARSG